MKKYITRILLFCFFLFPFSIYAENDETEAPTDIVKNYCIKDNCSNDTCGTYEIKYKSDSSLSLTDIANSIRNGTLSNEITAIRTAFKCTNEGENFTSCPSESDEEDVQSIVSSYTLDTEQSNINVVFKESNGKFDIDIVDVYSGKFIFYNAGTYPLKSVDSKDMTDKIKEDPETYNPAEYIDTSKIITNFNDDKILELVDITKNGKTVKGYKLTDVSGDDTQEMKLKIEVYQKSGDCAGIMVGAFSIKLPALDTVDVANPAISNPTEYGCGDVNSFKPKGIKISDTALNDLKNDLIGECDSKNRTIKYTQKVNLKSTILEKFENLKALFGNNDDNDDSNNNKINSKCNEEKTKTRFVKYIKKKYWAATVSEEYTIKGDQAKLVKAGDGFEYETNYSITRYVTIVQISKPVRPPQCVTTYGHICYWPGGSGSDGGPNEDFDSCVLKCDGGKYTQNCINSCYLNVYGVNRDLSFIDKFSYSNQEKDSSVSRTASCVTDHGNAGTVAGNPGDYYCVSSYCSANGWCNEWAITGPSGCSWSPGAEYDRQVDTADTQLDTLLRELNVDMTSSDYIGDYSYKITDTYLKYGDEMYDFVVDSSNPPILGVEAKYASGDNGVIESAAAIKTSYSTKTYHPYIKRKVNITVNLPLSAVNKVTGQSVYRSKDDDNFVFSVNANENKLDRIDNISLLDYYAKTDRKYYTSVWSKNYNVKYDDQLGVIKLTDDAEFNINVSNTSAGEEEGQTFSSNIQCYYGVYNKFYNDCDPDDPTCCDPSVDICGGIQYIYRPIDLDDVFPNDRSPRWNWTGKITNGKSTGAALTSEESFYNNNQTVNPEQLISDIQEKGYEIYDVSSDSREVDYEFVLTTENIRNIRKYNKSVSDYNKDGSNNYLDYNMSCYDSNGDAIGGEVCTSRFLDNIDGNSGTEENNSFITYSVNGYGITERKSIAGCNNAIGGTECDY